MDTDTDRAKRRKRRRKEDHGIDGSDSNMRGDLIGRLFFAHRLAAGDSFCPVFEGKFGPRLRYGAGCFGGSWTFDVILSSLINLVR